MPLPGAYLGPAVHTGMETVDEQVARYYRETTLHEWRRLVRDPFQERLEFGTTLHYLRKYLPPRGEVLDAGGGPGRYTVALAQQGYRTTLLDRSPELLLRARWAIRRGGAARQVRDVVEGDIRDLSRFQDGTFDAVLCLGGPLGHLLRARDRARAIAELVRVAKPGAPLFISVIGRWAIIEGELVRPARELVEDPDVVDRMLRTGDYLGGYGFAPAHFYLPEELERAMKRQGIRIEERVGLEGLATHHQTVFNQRSRREPEAIERWLSVHAATCTDPAIVATSHHFLIVGRKGSRSR